MGSMSRDVALSALFVAGKVLVDRFSL